MKKIGFTIGKFAPLHKGHQYLIEKALLEMDEVYIVIYETDAMEIPIEVRAEWIKTLYPRVNILFGYNPPNQYGLDPESVKIQMEYLIKILGDIKPTHFYSSEEYGKYVAEYLNIEEVLVDKKRNTVPISASQIRKDIERNKIYLHENVYKDIEKK
jgi:HTH-type transcriptional repressor of NAD biosynthesis genes